MIVKKFQAPTEMEAIIKAREELGSTAVVLNIKSIKQRGLARLFKKDAVEVTAALEEKDIVDGINKNKPVFDNNAASGQEAKPERMINQSMVSGGTSSTINLIADDNTAVSSASAIEQKLDSLHNLLQNQGSLNSDMPSSGSQGKTVAASAYTKRMSDIKEDISGAAGENKQVKERENANYKFLQLIYKNLIDNEVDSRFADEIIGEIENSLKKESNLDSILAAVYQKIILKLGKPKTIEMGDKAKVIFFIGPTGVGKTTTIAKIASSFKIEKEARVAFITADTYRIAAVEQLNTYASIIDCPVSVVYSVEDMNKSLSEYKDYDLILVDTAGRSHKATEQMDELKAFIEEVAQRADEFDFECYLTLSLTTKYKDLKSIADKYDDVDWAVIFTKLDETCSVGNILNIRMLTDRPLSYTTSGQNVPDDIEVINEQGVARQLLGGGE
ncbi:MAG TPA: flagellar biosynthesis protein FlhF [Eubacterium sp.]|jgi:flagellar biosynthesis protein FlhF|nr:flagellar biosynthesis protein FlhF [Eubacterium sp.]HBD67263.1 flagellar biosynthesis protein FlhF [Eubacterium sp.]HBS90237.1 flagellar biosynthesis protein FlhF [Eubacterium sp.]HCH83579.1 flagellar biosynthesis protein FlhF [Eubacterium sp.]